MKSEFIAKPLSDLADIQTGPFGSQLHKEDYVQTGTPIVTVEHLGKKKFTEQNLPCVSDTDKARLSKYILRKGDIVFSRVGSVDRCSYVSDDYDGWMFSGRCLRVRPLSEIDSQYLYYYFTLESTKKFVRGIATGATMPSINTKFMGEVPITYPPIEVQCKIASILSTLDDKIELNNKINKNLFDQVMALYKYVFDDESATYRTCRADEYFDISIGKTPPRKEQEWFSHDPKDERWVSISDMGNCGLYISDSSEYLTHDAVSRFNIIVVPDNTVLLSFKLTVGRLAITDGEMCTNEAIAHFKTVKPEINPYLYCYLKSFNYRTLGSTSSIATAVNSKIIKAMPFAVPTEEALQSFNRIALPAFAAMKEKQMENRSLANIRDSLLPKLMSGEIDISGIDL